MKKLFTLGATMLLSGIGFLANASNMGEATTTMPLDSYAATTVLDGGYYSYPSTMIITWDNQEVSFVEGLDNSAISFTITNLTNPDQAVMTRAGQSNLHPGTGYTAKEKSEFVYLSLGYGFENGCEYRVDLPEGIFQNENGDTNPAQSFTFHVCTKTFSYYDATVTPQETNNQSPVYYLANELNDVTVTWKDYTLEETGVGKILAYKTENINNTNVYTYIDITDKTYFKDGVLHIDISSLPDSFWYIYITEGYFKCMDGDQMKINYQVSLSYLISTPSPFNTDDFKVTNPLEGSLLTQLSSVSVTFGQPIKLVENGPKVTITNGDQTYETNLKIEYSSGNFGLTAVLPQVMQLPGTYHVTIPEGVVTNGKYQNLKHEFEYLVTPYYDKFSVNPDGGTVTSKQMENIVLTFDGANSVSLCENPSTIYYFDGNYNQVTLSFEDNITIAGNTVTISIPDLAPGKCMLNINPFVFMIDDTYVNPYINLNYTIWNGMPAATVIEAPADYGISGPDGVILLEWEGQTVTPTEDFKVQYAYTNQSFMETKADLPSDAYKLVNVQNQSSTNYNGLCIYLDKVFEVFNSNEGKSTNPYYANSIAVIVPDGVLKNEEGLVNPQEKFNFSFYNYIDSEPTFAETETEGIYAIVWPEVSQIDISFGSVLTMTNSGTEEDTEITCKDSYSYGQPDPGYFSIAYLNPDEYSNPCLMVNLSEMPDGNYVLNIPKAVVKLQQKDNFYDSFINNTLSFPVKIGETNSVKIEKISNIYRVYNLQGIKVLETEDPAQLNTLSTGLYIINGKKVLIRN